MVLWRGRKARSAVGSWVGPGIRGPGGPSRVPLPLPPNARVPVGPCSASSVMGHGHEGISSAGGGGDGWRLHARRFRIGGFKVEKYKKPVKLGKSSTSLRALATVAKSSCCEGRTSSPRNRRWSHASVSSAHRKPPCHRGRGRHPCTRRRPGTRRPRGSMDASKQRRKDSIAASASLPSRRRCRSRCFGSCLGHA